MINRIFRRRRFVMLLMILGATVIIWLIPLIARWRLAYNERLDRRWYWENKHLEK